MAKVMINVNWAAIMSFSFVPHPSSPATLYINRVNGLQERNSLS